MAALRIFFLLLLAFALIVRCSCSGSHLHTALDDDVCSGDGVLPESCEQVERKLHDARAKVDETLNGRARVLERSASLIFHLLFSLRSLKSAHLIHGLRRQKATFALHQTSS